MADPFAELEIDMPDAEFADLVLRYLEAELSEQETAVLNGILAEDEHKRDVFVAVCTHASVLTETLSNELSDRHMPLHDPVAPPPADRGILSRIGWVGAAAKAAAWILIPAIVGAAAMLAWRSDSANRFTGGSGGSGYVAELTDQADAGWADGTPPVLGTALRPEPVRLESGFAEIKFDSGARVVLEGPAEFTPLGRNSGHLQYGKLTAHVGEEAHGFTVETPDAKIVDLGTAFGVRAHPEGGAEVHVFTGQVIVEPKTPRGVHAPSALKLTENRAARVEAGGTVLTQVAVDPSRFARELRLKLDLVDVVAGGDGFSGRRNRGINPADGSRTAPSYIGTVRGNGVFRPVPWHAFIDGVFIPDGGEGPVTLDSAGHDFWRFPDTDGQSHGPIWSGGLIFVRLDRLREVRTKLGGVDYNEEGHGVIGMHANKGITFDLDAIRAANPTWKITNFRAVAGNTEMAKTIDPKAKQPASADVWVFVDGQERYRQTNISSEHGAFPIDVEISEHHRFLTLVSTDAGNQHHNDWIIFGDPRLEMTPKRARPVAAAPTTVAGTPKSPDEQVR